MDTPKEEKGKRAKKIRLFFYFPTQKRENIRSIISSVTS